MISVIIPVFNEEESLLVLHPLLKKEVKKITQQFELIYVDDGSTDSSFKILQKIAKKDKKIKIFSFRKNRGKAEALDFGFSRSRGDYIVTLDADLQDQPQEIHILLNKAKKGWDLVCGWRKNRKDTKGIILISKLFNLLTGKFWGLELHDYNCGLKVYKKEAAKSLKLYGGMHRFIPLLIYQQGFKVTEVAVIHKPRKFGKSKYGFSKVWKDLPDLFTMLFLSRYGNRPLHFFGLVGGLLSLLGLVVLLYLTFIWFQGESIGRRPLLFLGMLLVLAGIQTFFTGFLADLFINLLYTKKENNTPLLKYSSDRIK